MTDDIIILDEDISPDYEPTREEIVDYALYLGMELPRDDHLLWIATEGLKAPLPPRWKAVKHKDNENEVYYFNFKTGESQWDHPCDQFYKDLYSKEKEKEAKAAASAVAAAATTTSIADNSSSALSKQSPAPLQAISKDRLILGKLPKMERKLESLKKMPAPPSLLSFDKGKSIKSNVQPLSISAVEERKAFDEWVVKEKERIEVERQEWTIKRQLETDAWIQARTAEVDAERQRRVLELRHQVEDELAKMQRDYEQRIQGQREKLLKDQLEHEKEMESRRAEWLDAVKEGIAKKDSMLKERIAELQHAHQEELHRHQKDMQAKLQAIDCEEKEILKIQSDAIESRKAELKLRLEHLENEGREQERRKRQDWDHRLLQIEREGREKCRQTEEQWSSECKTTELTAAKNYENLRDELTKSKKTIQMFEKKLKESESHNAENNNSDAKNKLRSLTEENTRLESQVSELEAKISDSVDTFARIKELEKLLQESKFAFEKLRQERDKISQQFEEYKAAQPLRQMHFRQGSDLDRTEENVSYQSDGSHSEGEEATKTITDFDIEQVFESELSDVDMSDIGFDGSFVRIHTKWNSQLQREQTAIEHARQYLVQEKKLLVRAKESILKDQEKWKKDRQRAVAINNGYLPASAERDLKRRKRMLDLRTRRLNSDISQYLKLKRGLESRQNGLYRLQREATVSDHLPDATSKGNPDRNEESGKSLELRHWATTVPKIGPPATDAKATLQSHSDWLKSFRSEVMRKNSASASELPGTTTPRYLLQKHGPIKPSPAISMPTATQNNDITIRIKVEK